MAIEIKNSKTISLPDWTQTDLDNIIAGGSPPLPPPGTLISQVVLASDWGTPLSTSMATGKIVGRSTAGTGSFEEISVGSGLTLSSGTLTANPGGLADGDKGDITVSSGATVWTIDNNVVSNAKAAQMAANTIKGNNTGATANATDLTATQATAMLDVFTSSAKGLAPSSGGGTTNFLRADGTWAAPSGGGGAPGGANTQIQYNSSGTFAGSADLTWNQTTKLLTIGGRVYQTGLGASTYFGSSAGAVDDLANRFNAGFGYQALQATTTGSLNTALGFNTLPANISGNSNVAVGANTLVTLTSGSFNVAVGAYCLNLNTGNSNLAIGYQTLYNNSTGANNTGFGGSALYNNNTGSSNLAGGSAALFSNTGGNNNIGLGANALQAKGAGSDNTAIGYAAGLALASGSNNVFIGSGADVNGNYTNAIAVGSGAVATASNSAKWGNTSITDHYFNNTVNVTIGSAATKGAIVKAAASQTANLQEWQNSAGTALSTVKSNGAITVPDDAYAAGWNGSTEVPTKNAVYDKVNSMFTGTANITVGTTAPSSPAFGDLWVDTN